MLKALTCTSDQARRLFRRWAAFSCLFVLQLYGIVTLWALVFSNDKTGVADALVRSWPVVSTIIAPLTTIVLAYFGVSTLEQLRRPSDGGQQPNAGAGAAS